MAPDCAVHDCDNPADLRVVVYDHRDTDARIHRDFCVNHILAYYFT